MAAETGLGDGQGNRLPDQRAGMMRAAMQAMRALTPWERGLVLVWFCPVCLGFTGPGDRCPCPQPPADP